MDYNEKILWIAKKYKRRVVFSFPDREIEYTGRDLELESRKMLSWLIANGEKYRLSKGSRIGLLMGNSPEMLSLIAGALRAGMVAVPISVYEDREEIDRICRECAVCVLIYDETNKYVAPKVEDKPEWFLSVHGDFSAPLLPDTWRCPIAVEDTVVILCSSGSTGQRKLIPKNSKYYQFGLISSKLVAIGFRIGLLKEDLCGQFYHLMGMADLLNVLNGNCAQIITTSHFIPTLESSYINKTKPFVWHGTGSMLYRVCRNYKDGYYFPRVISTSGEALRDSVIEELMKQKHAKCALSFYGSTEVGGVCANFIMLSGIGMFIRFIFNVLAWTKILDPQTWRYVRPKGVQGLDLGTVYKNVAVKIVSPATGACLNDGMCGEICVSSKTVMRNYLNQTENADQWYTIDGKQYFRTGDLGAKVGNRLFLRGRLKNLIIRSGENIIPGDVEEAVLTYPGMEECVAVGVPSDQYGEDIKVYFQANTQIDVQALRDYVQEKIPRIMWPASYCQLEEFPLNASGKADRLKLAQIQ